MNRDDNLQFNGTPNNTLTNNGTRTTPLPITTTYSPQSVGFLAVAIPLLITGVIAILILILVCIRCKRKREGYYDEAYDFSLVDQSIQANQSSIIGHTVLMAHGTEYHEIGDTEEPPHQMEDNQNGVLRFSDDLHQDGKVPDAEDAGDIHLEKSKSCPLSNAYINDYFVVDSLKQSPYFVLEPCKEPRYVNER
ncbi:uncharacterized protein LOC125655264 isoform X3 [Ostrea edulis]|nr:uncharacterized protein LOC125655264 isoform X3 [Ostrea edulis]